MKHASLVVVLDHLSGLAIYSLRLEDIPRL